MLTSELINQNVEGLTEAQVSALVQLSANDENQQIAKKVGEIYGGLDNDILATSNIEKNGTEKTYDYAKRVITELQGKVTEANGQVAELTKEKARLEKAVAEGGDAETRKALAQAQKDLSAVTKQYTDLRAEHDGIKESHARELQGLRLEGEIANALSGVKFKSDIPQAVTDVIRRRAIDKVKGMETETIDDGKGGKVVVFKGENGEILRNPEHGLEPYTAGELVLKELNTMGIISEARKKTGTGTQDPKPDVTSSVGIAGARTQDEAFEIIRKELLTKGLVQGSDAFKEAMNTAWKENHVASLPER